MTGHWDPSRLERVVPGPDYPEIRSRRWNVTIGIAVVIIAVLAIVAAASRGAPESSHSQSPSETAGAEREGTTQALLGTPHGTSRNEPTAGRTGSEPEPAGAERRNPASGVPPTVDRYRGTATWYCLSGSSACTRGYGPSDLVAAIDTDLGFSKGDVVTVRYRDRAVTVTVVDVCLCAGERLIDLTSGAFRRLAPLGHGVIPVTVELVGTAATLPPTEALP